MKKDTLIPHISIDEYVHLILVCILIKGRIISNKNIDITISDIIIDEKVRDSDNEPKTILMEKSSRIVVSDADMLPIDDILKQTALVLADMKSQSGVALYLAKPIKITIKNMNDTTNVKNYNDTKGQIYSLINHHVGDILDFHIDYSIN